MIKALHKKNQICPLEINLDTIHEDNLKIFNGQFGKCYLNIKEKHLIND